MPNDYGPYPGIIGIIEELQKLRSRAAAYNRIKAEANDFADSADFLWRVQAIIRETEEANG